MGEGDCSNDVTMETLKQLCEYNSLITMMYQQNRQVHPEGSQCLYVCNLNICCNSD